MRPMKEQHIAHLEAQLEQIVEGAFANLFGKRLRAQDIALQLARAMEDGLSPSRDSDPRPIAPDQYVISMNPSDQVSLLQRQPTLAQTLSKHLIELALLSGYRMGGAPMVQTLPNDDINTGSIVVEAHHTGKKASTTAVMHKVDTPVREQQPAPLNPQLIVNGRQSILLNRDIVNIGRGRDNHLVVDDPHVSRHHAQLRLRFGRFVLFDTQSRGGTLVNDQPVEEHTLHPGDVIGIGETRLLYIEDEPGSLSQTGVYEPPERPDSPDGE